jgi:hypothetical protein
VQLRLTRHALEDLGLQADVLARTCAREYEDAHPFVRGFVDRRSQNPQGQETTALPVTNAVVYNLHFGRLRGLTWYDEESDVVWLLGVGWHESKSREDAYNMLKRRDENGELMPTEQDYLDLEMSWEEARSFAATVAEEAPALAAQARGAGGTEVRGLIAGRLEVGVVVIVVADDQDQERLEEIWVAFSLPPQSGPCELPPQSEWLTVVLAAMVPVPITAADLRFGGDFPRDGGSRPHEVVVHWRSY